MTAYDFSEIGPSAAKQCVGFVIACGLPVPAMDQMRSSGRIGPKLSLLSEPVFRWSIIHRPAGLGGSKSGSAPAGSNEAIRPLSFSHVRMHISQLQHSAVGLIKGSPLAASLLVARLPEPSLTSLLGTAPFFLPVLRSLYIAAAHNK